MHGSAQRLVALATFITCTCALSVGPIRAQSSGDRSTTPAAVPDLELSPSPSPPTPTKRIARTEIALGVILLHGAAALWMWGIALHGPALFCFDFGDPYACPPQHEGAPAFVAAGVATVGGLALLIHGSRTVRKHNRFLSALRDGSAFLRPYVRSERSGVGFGLTSGARF